MSTFQQKLIISICSAALFILVTLPQTYKLTSSLTSLNLYNPDTECPTNLGLILHTLVFFVLTYLSMWNAPHSAGLKLKFSIYGTLIFYLISSPAMFSLMNSILGNKVATPSGCPTMTGILLHSLVYCFALVGVMYLPPELE
ncbi:hypothetical protein Indivirus_11_3 [Indivirus ILV1]|uniref:Uncharacterized protein n=1 Tax=Indivirus ILV1 TaxID=1977633 RepID=A0A1V0SEA8_9VIRU|nr:hypothetical protein Indivirus_11_3 [Indivirus ILV1]